MSAWPETPLTRLLGIRYPIVQAPMAGGPTTPELVAAVSEAGGLGSLGLAFAPAGAVSEAIRATRALTGKPFGVNLFMPVAAETVDVLLEERPAVFSFTFGAPPPEAVAALKGRGIALIGTATTTREAVALEALRVDAVVAQGSEAGGHRGTFAAAFEDALVGGIALVPQVADAVSVPVIAAGGIMDGRGIVAALALGAAGVQMGTAFLTVRESGVPAAAKQALRAAPDESTRMTAAVSGKPARAVRNRLVEEAEGLGEPQPFPQQIMRTQRLRDPDDPERSFLLAGQAASLARDCGAAELVDALAAEVEATLRGLA